MSDNAYNWFKLSNANGFGPKSIHYMYNHIRNRELSMHELFALTPGQFQNHFPEIGKGKLSRANFATLQQLDEEKIYASYRKLKEEKVHIITLDDERYPKTVLGNMQDSAPPILFCKGYLHLLNTKGVSIVGSRDVDDCAVTLTKNIASDLAANGYNVTSGYAKGVDTGAHTGALEAGGTTTMILSFGITQISIKREMKFLDWKKNSLFISQFHPNDKFSGQNAMMRNKLVCAMSKAIVVIASGPEKDSSGRMSGTFDAGKTALKMNVPVFVLNPKILTPSPQGNIDLINLGGIEFSNGKDIVRHMEIYNPELVQMQEPKAEYLKNGSTQEDKSINKTSNKDSQTSLDF